MTYDTTVFAQVACVVCAVGAAVFVGARAAWINANDVAMMRLASSGVALLFLREDLVVASVAFLAASVAVWAAWSVGRNELQGDDD